MASRTFVFMALAYLASTIICRAYVAPRVLVMHPWSDSALGVRTSHIRSRMLLYTKYSFEFRLRRRALEPLCSSRARSKNKSQTDFQSSPLGHQQRGPAFHFQKSLSGQAILVSAYTKGTADVLHGCFDGEPQLAFDSEGVRLSRRGNICIIQLMARNKPCFLFDVLGKTREDPLVCWLRKVLEDKSIVKIVHDCKMDSDALWHNLGIKLQGSHDTSAWNKVIYSSVDNLNSILAKHGIAQNQARDMDAYKKNPRFWAQRPLTQAMIARASGDVASMFELYDKQLLVTASDSMKRDQAAQLSVEARDYGSIL